MAKSEKIRLGNSFNIKASGFWPNEAQLLEAGHNELMNLKVKSLRYDNMGSLMRLTFMFSDGTQSPPKHSYSQEPQNEYAVKGAIGSLHLGLNKDPTLISLQICDQGGKQIYELKGSMTASVTKVEKLKLSKTEHIVSADIEVKQGGAFTQSIQLIAYKH